MAVGLVPSLSAGCPLIFDIFLSDILQRCIGLSSAAHSSRYLLSWTHRSTERLNFRIFKYIQSYCTVIWGVLPQSSASLSCLLAFVHFLQNGRCKSRTSFFKLDTLDRFSLVASIRFMIPDLYHRLLQICLSARTLLATAVDHDRKVPSPAEYNCRPSLLYQVLTKKSKKVES